MAVLNNAVCLLSWDDVEVDMLDQLAGALSVIMQDIITVCLNRLYDR